MLILYYNNNYKNVLYTYTRIFSRKYHLPLSLADDNSNT